MQQEDNKPMTLMDLTQELHLRAVRNKYDELLQVAQREKWSYERFICSLLDAEYRQRLENSQAKRLRTAGFPQYKYIEDLKRDELPEGITQLSQVNFWCSNSAYSCTNMACRCEFPQMAARISSL